MRAVTELLCKAGGRQVNQDHCDYREHGDSACWVLADGLGGHQGGETASRLVVDAVLASFRGHPACTAEMVRKALDQAQKSVLEEQQKHPELNQMRSTAVMLLTDYRQAAWGYIGDSRLYHFRKGRLVLQSKDHSVPQSLVSAGEILPREIRFHEDRNRLLKAVGNPSAFSPSVCEEPLRLLSEDVFLLCSDGFWEYVTEMEMEVDLAKSVSPKEWLSFLEERLIEVAPENNDNYTALAVFFHD